MVSKLNYERTFRGCLVTYHGCYRDRDDNTYITDRQVLAIPCGPCSQDVTERPTRKLTEGVCVSTSLDSFTSWVRDISLGYRTDT